MSPVGILNGSIETAEVQWIDEQAERIASEAFSVDPPKTSNALNAWLFSVLAFMSILPFWTVRYPVICDYPNHLARWFVLFHARDQAYQFSSYYTPAWGPLPYISTDLLALALQYFLPIDIAGRLVLTICILSIPVGTLYFLKKACPENTPFALFAILVSFNPNLLMGSLSNQLSIAFCLLAVGLWIDYCQQGKLTKALLLVTILVLLYLSHLIGFAIAGVVMGLYALFQPAKINKLLTLAAISLPSLILFAYNIAHAEGDTSFIYGWTLWNKLRNLVIPVRLLYSKPLDTIVLIALAAILFSLLLRREYIKSQRVWMIITGILILAYLVAPSEYHHGGYLDVRIMPFVYLFALAIFQVTKIPRVAVAGLTLLVLFRIATVEHMFLVKQPELRSLSAAFEVIPRDARVLPIVSLQQYVKTTLVGQGGPHHWGYGVIQKGFLVPTIFHIPGVQPIRISATAYCPDTLCSFSDPKDVNWQKISQNYDYIWLEKYPVLESAAANWGDPIFRNNVLTVFRVRH